MADFEVLVRALEPLEPETGGTTEQNNKNVEINKGRYRIGDVIMVRPTGWGWGAMESKVAWDASSYTGPFPGDFYIITMTDVDITQDALTAALEEVDWDITDEGLETEVIVKNARRKNKFDYPNLPTPVKNTLATDFAYTVDWSTVKSYLKKKSDDSAVFV
jgi:hypothetical protein